MVCRGIGDIAVIVVIVIKEIDMSKGISVKEVSMKAKKFVVFTQIGEESQMELINGGQVIREMKKGLIVKPCYANEKVFVDYFSVVTYLASEKIVRGAINACWMCLEQCKNVKKACDEEYKKNVSRIKENARLWASRKASK